MNRLWGCQSRTRFQESELAIDVSKYMPEDAAFYRNDALSPAIAKMAGSRILAVAQEVKELQAKGVEICDVSIGDYDPTSYLAPQSFLDVLTEEIQAGRNHYPPSDGLLTLREALSSFYENTLGVKWAPNQFVVCGGARPPIYAIFRTLVSEGDEVVYGVPSWNNDYYVHLCGGVNVPIQTTANDNFLPTVSQVREHISTARLICLCSPLNPTGTVFDAETLTGICQLIVAENKKRLLEGRRLLYLMFDQVYWPLTFDRDHVHPLQTVPEIAPYVIYVDAISKWMVGTGLRLGWAIVPTYLYNPMKDFMGHVGAWAPRPVQMATAATLRDPDALRVYWAGLRAALETRLNLIYNRVLAMYNSGLPVDCTVPQGAIYASVQIRLFGAEVAPGQYLRTNNEIRKYLLHEARIALTPFQAFSLWEESGWFRMSVGSVSEADLMAGMDRLEAAIRKVSLRGECASTRPVPSVPASRPLPG